MAGVHPGVEFCFDYFVFVTLDFNKTFGLLLTLRLLSQVEFLSGHGVDSAVAETEFAGF